MEDPGHSFRNQRSDEHLLQPSRARTDRHSRLGRKGVASSARVLVVEIRAGHRSESKSGNGIATVVSVVQVTSFSVSWNRKAGTESHQVRLELCSIEPQLGRICTRSILQHISTVEDLDPDFCIGNLLELSTLPGKVEKPVNSRTVHVRGVRARSIEHNWTSCDWTFIVASNVSPKADETISTQHRYNRVGRKCTETNLSRRHSDSDERLVLGCVEVGRVRVARLQRIRDNCEGPRRCRQDDIS
mmetsp:Transcript_14378/g.34048  ORF Transcript_14378/g.34048 Transcript_14378/m.34048 type:complete len:244 (-) Transcript_14378:1492-2223(-)